jgi:hypothetical protein
MAVPQRSQISAPMSACARVAQVVKVRQNLPSGNFKNDFN